MRLLCTAAVFLLSTSLLFAEDNPTANYIKQGYEQMRAGKHKAALRFFESAIKVDPNCVEGYVGLGNCYIEMGDNPASTDFEIVEKGVVNLRYALKLKSDLYPAVHYNLAVGYLALNYKDLALQEYEILKSSDKEIADKLAVKIKSFKGPEKYVFVGSSRAESSGGNYRRPDCGSGETYSPTTNTCGKSVIPSSGGETVGQRELAEVRRREEDRKARLEEAKAAGRAEKRMIEDAVRKEVNRRVY